MKTVKTKRLTHLYEGDAVPDHHGDDRCLWCGLPRTADRHHLPAQPAEADAHDAAVLGEHEEN